MAPEGGSLVVIPTYNEAQTIRRVVEGVLGSDRTFEILVVDDGSPDGTAEIVQSMGEGRVNLLRRPSKEGLGRAYVAGFRWGLERDYRMFVEMDADLSHDPAMTVALIEAAEDSDLAIGSRYVGGGRVEGWSRARHALSRAGNLYARLILGFGVRDATSGFRCFRREVLAAIDLDSVSSTGYAFQIDMAYRAWLLGFRITEVPITFVERRAGTSKMSGSIALEALSLITSWGLRDLVTGRRFRKGPPAR